jgi:transaldolase
MNGIEIYADTSNINEIFDIYENNKLVKGFTTNPSLMKKAGIVKYIPFIKEITSKISDLPFSFEIFADELLEMEYQIQKITEYGENIYVKVPITNTKSQSTVGLIEKMSNRGIKINVTAVFTKSQTDNILKKLSHIKTPSIISIFAGRIADTGINPCPLVSDVSLAIKQKNTSIKTLWASTRTVYNVYEAEQSGCDIITVTPDILPKLKLKNKNLDEFSLETVKMFYNDAKNAGYAL